MKTNMKTLLRTLWQSVMKRALDGNIELGRLSNENLHLLPEITEPPYSWQRVPNVRKFRIKKLSRYDGPLWAHTGIQKRLRKPEIEFEAYRNKCINRYVDYQFKKMWHYRYTDPRKFWVIGQYLLHSSVSYWVVIYNKVYPNWYKNQRYSEVLHYLKLFLSLDLTKYRYKITEIPKADGRKRMLGIPDADWRLYLHGLNNILLLWLSPYVSPDQHGYYPGRGTATAIYEVQRRVLASREIYEFDLKSFFDTINLDYLGKVLQSVGLPKALVDLLISWSRSNPYKGTNTQQWTDVKEEALTYKYHRTGQWGFAKGISELEWWINRKREAEVETPEKQPKSWYQGVSQGSAVSPLLSTLLLTHPLLTHETNNNLQYADDGIIFGDKLDLSVLSFPAESGIKINEAKSGWIKLENKWLKPLKFLGVLFIPAQYLQQPLPALSKGVALIRKKSDLEEYTFTDREGFQKAALEHLLESSPATDYELNWRLTHKEELGEWSDIHLTVYNNYILSLLYNSSYNAEVEEQDKSLHCITNSWLSVEEYRKTKITGSYRINGRTVSHPYDLYNVSSFAIWSLYDRIKYLQAQGRFPKRIPTWVNQVSSIDRNGPLKATVK